MKPKWTQKETKLLQQHYSTTPKEEILKLLPERTWKAIHAKAYNEGLHREKPFTYNEEETEIVKALWECGSKEEIMKLLPGRSWDSITAKTVRLGIRRRVGGEWMNWETQYLKANWKTTPREELLNELYPRTWIAIKDMALRLRLGREVPHWKDEELDYLKRNYVFKSVEEIAEDLGRSVQGIYHKIEVLGLSEKRDLLKIVKIQREAKQKGMI